MKPTHSPSSGGAQQNPFSPPSLHGNSLPVSKRIASIRQPIIKNTQIKTINNVTFTHIEGSLSSHHCIDDFGEYHHIHCPEMTFFDNILTITHHSKSNSTTGDNVTVDNASSSKPGFTLSFNAVDAILYTNYALATDAEKALHSSYIPSIVQVKDAKEWQNQPIVSSYTSTDNSKNDWTLTSLFRGTVYPIYNPLDYITSTLIDKNSQLQQPSLNRVSPLSNESPSKTKSIEQQISKMSLSDATPKSTTSQSPSATATATPAPSSTIDPSIPPYCPRLPFGPLSHPAAQWKQSPPTASINYELLKQRDPILMYANIVLYEDELHDHGISTCTVKFRVTEKCYFILLRSYVRVDHITVRIRDTRIFHEYNTDYIYRETKLQEVTWDELKQLEPCSSITEPSVNTFTADYTASLLPVQYTLLEHIVLSDIV